MKKLLVSSVVVLFALSALFTLSPTEKTAFAQDTLVIAGRAGTMTESVIEATELYEQATGTNVSITTLPYDSLYEKLVISMRGGASTFDLIMMDDPWLPQFYKADFLANLDPLYANSGLKGPSKDFVQNSVDLCKGPEGHVRCLPLVGNVQIFVYREDLLKKYGVPTPPKTWAQVLEAAKKITEEEQGVTGYAIRGKRGNPVVTSWLPLFWAHGGQMFDKNMKPQLNSKAGLQALKDYLKLRDYGPEGVSNFDSDQIITALAQGKTAMAIAWPGWVGVLNNPQQSEVVGKVKFSAVPGESSAMLGNWLLGIPKNAKNKKQAFHFLRWITSSGAQKLQALQGGVPTRKSVYKQPDLQEINPFYPAQLDSLQNARPRPRIPEYSEVESVLGIQLSRAVAGAISPEKALDNANKKIENIMKEAGYYD
ncbi:MAG: ABC transporter substrate-binding protein [Candidatus Bipolaricaulia bacterium]